MTKVVIKKLFGNALLMRRRVNLQKRRVDCCVFQFSSAPKAKSNAPISVCNFENDHTSPFDLSGLLTFAPSCDPNTVFNLAL